MPVVMCRRPEFKWRLHKSKCIYMTFGVLNITVRIACICNVWHQMVHVLNVISGSPSS
jgi:hypothetical protein